MIEYFFKKYWIGLLMTVVFIAIGWASEGNFNDGMFLACLHRYWLGIRGKFQRRYVLGLMSGHIHHYADYYFFCQVWLLEDYYDHHRGNRQHWQMDLVCHQFETPPEMDYPSEGEGGFPRAISVFGLIWKPHRHLGDEGQLLVCFLARQDTGSEGRHLAAALTEDFGIWPRTQ